MPVDSGQKPGPSHILIYSCRLMFKSNPKLSLLFELDVARIARAMLMTGIFAGKDSIAVLCCRGIWQSFSCHRLSHVQIRSEANSEFLRSETHSS